MCTNGPSRPMLRPPPAAPMRPKILAANVLIVKYPGISVPANIHFISGSPLPAAAGCTKAVKNTAINTKITEKILHNGKVCMLLLMSFSVIMKLRISDKPSMALKTSLEC